MSLNDALRELDNALEQLRREVKRAAIECTGLTTERAESYANAAIAGITRGLITLESVIRDTIKKFS